MEEAVCGTLPSRIPKRNLVFIIVHGCMARLVSLHHVFDADWLVWLEDRKSLVVTAMASSSEASAALLPSSMVLLRCNHGLLFFELIQEAVHAEVSELLNLGWQSRQCAIFVRCSTTAMG
jgi:hypothetical protein